MIILLTLLLILPGLAKGITLEDALGIAQKNVLDLKVNELELKKAHYELKKALAGILPRVQASYSFTRLDDNLVFGFGIRDREEFLVALTQVIFNKTVFESIALSRKQKELKRLILEDVRKEVLYRTKEMFYALLYKRKITELMKENMEYWKKNLEEVKEKYELGILPKVEYIRAKAQYENARADFEEKRADYLKSLEDFKAFLRLSEIEEPEGELTFKRINISPEEAEELLERNNSTLKVAKKSVEVIKETIDLVKGEYYPSVEVFANYQGFTGRRTLFGGREWIRGYSIGFRLTYNIFDGFSREARKAQAKVDLLKEKEKFLQERFRIKAELRKVLLDLRSLEYRLKATKTSLEAAEESLRLSTERYRHGIASQLELLDARANYNKTLENYYFLLYRYNSLLAYLERLIY